MKSIVLLILVATLSCQIYLCSAAVISSTPILGGPGTPTSPIKLDATHAKIDSFIRTYVPQVANLKLISYREQVVSGMLYYYTYGPYTSQGKTSNI